MGRTMARAADLSALAASARERVAQRRFPIRIGYIGALGDANLGDEAMFAAAQRLMPRHRFIRTLAPWRESRLATMGLSGSRYFQAVVLGGGTLIGPYWLPLVDGWVQMGVPVITLGTGVGSSGFGDPSDVEIDAWIPHLTAMKAVGVRGPRSAAALRQRGIDHAETIGDLALTLAAAATVEPARKVLVNIAAAPGDDYRNTPALVELETVVAGLARQGYGIVPVALHATDIAPLTQLLAAAGLAGTPIHAPQTAHGFFALARNCAFTIAVRLHGAILSTCVGVPPLMLGYRDKCLDFMESMDLTDWHVPLDTALSGAVTERVGALAAAADGLREPILARALGYRATVEEYVARSLPRCR